ncbi:putative aminopeptidase-2 [Cataglyphis hispanica]|uniref:putative aminopeptidase-2 n=1 Tax=Cataglyphis hispanica TaxID=1086592 RepID=UPI00217FD06B|nr:putative aminopeptidase-2 [Cataglyphis hispanica]
MNTFRKHLLLYILIILFGGNVAEKFSLYEDILTQDADFEQYHEISQNDDSRLPNDYRLPTSVKPISYEIILTPKFQDNFTFEGTVKITAEVKNETDSITLHVGNIQITSRSILVDEQNVNLVNDTYDKVTEKYTLNFPQTLRKGSEILISFAYNGILNDNMIGFYKSSYFDEDDQIKWLAATQFQTTHARHAFPCFDEPSFKATFTIRISRNKNSTCLSNMPLNYTKEVNKDIFWDTFETNVLPMSTYLVAFVISEFKNSASSKNDFNVWSRPSVIDQTSYALKIGTEALELLGNIFEQEYQLPKMDMVAIPDFSAGAMENWGLVTYREPRMLYDEKESSAPAQQSVASVIVHELTHMWFGNLVTPEWWSYLWLSEAFARYFQYFGTAEIEKTWNMREQFVVEQHQSALIVDGFESSRPMTREVFSQSQIGGMGDSITYAKGASIVRMMNLTFGDNVFRLALRDYLRNNKEKGLGNPNALWKAMQDQVNLHPLPIESDVKTIMDTWTIQAGYPVVLINIDKGKLHITQQRFLLRNLNKTPTNVTWWVPLTWTTQSNPIFDNTLVKYWLSTEKYTTDFDIDPEEWVIFNVQSSGFYRVNYNYDGWQRIFNVLNSDKFDEIHVLNRAGIVDDLLNLGRAGLLDYKTVLNGIAYLNQETNYLPFKAAFNGLDYLHKRLTGYDEHFLFKKHVLSLIHNKRKALGYEDSTNDDRLTILLRREINNWACNLGDDECITVYMKKFKQWRANSSIPIKPNERTTTYCVAARYGTPEDWEFLWKQYLNSNYVTDQTVIISALGCSLNTTILEKYLRYAISSYATNRIRKQDSTNVFAAVYNSGLTGAEYILDFVEKHYKEMEKYYGGQSTIATILEGASQRFSTPRLVNKFQNLINGHKMEFAPILESLESSLKIARYELEWYKSASVPIIQWLQQKYRLPTNISPQKYVISITPYLEVENFTVDGHVMIEADVVQQTNQIILHSAEIKHHTVNVTANQTPVQIVNQHIEKEYDFFVINLDQKLPVGTKLIIEIEYTSHLNTSELRGFYKSSYVNENGKTRWLAATHLEPVGARKMFPCFDEPAMKALFTVQVSVPTGYNAVSNMEWRSITKVDDRLLYTFFESVKMSTYLVAVIISDFKINPATNIYPTSKTKYAVIARPNAINQTKYAASEITEFVNFFETTMKQQYKLSKLYMVALPDFPSGAGENWGLLTYRESYLLYDENHSPITSRQNIRNVIAHEISHQWFGNLVTPLWWKYLWLNEGFARYFEYHAPALIFIPWKLEWQFVVDQVHSAFKADSSKSSHALNHDVYSPSEIRSKFDSISYNKGASILRMLETSYGNEIFYEALSDYLSKRKYDVATPEDLYAAIQTQATKRGLKDNITAILNTWVNQPGYPVVHVDINESTIILRQERFFFKQDENNSDTWHIPITWALVHKSSEYDDTTPKLWLTKDEMKISRPQSSTSLLTFNVQQSGYYRVNYDKKYWMKLFDYLKTSNNINTIHKINRAALIDDLMNLARADYIDYKTVISALTYLNRESNYIPWRAFYNNLPYLNNRFRGRSIEDIYKIYLKSLIRPLYERLGFKDKWNDDSNLTILLKIYTRKWACKLEIGDCKFYAAYYFQQKLRHSKKIPPNYRDVVYCTAMSADTTNNTYEFLWKEYLNSNVATDKLVILSSLACSQNKDILEKLLRDAIAEDSYIRYQDSAKVFSDVYDASLIGIEVVMNVIKNNYDDILRKHFDDYTKIGNIVNSLASRLSTQQLYKQYRNLLDWLVEREPAFNKFVDSYLLTAQYEFDWYERKAPIIFEEMDKQFLNNKYRLPRALYPELYNITLKPYIEKGIFEGHVQIYMRAENDTMSIILNSHNLNISNIKVFKNYMVGNKLNAEPIQLLNYTNEQFPQQLRIYLSSEVKNAENIMAEIDFNGTLNDNMEGFYRSFYFDDAGHQYWVATTQFEPAHAREAFPCFDEPAFKSNFIINIKRPNNYNTLSNMPLSKMPQYIELKDENYKMDIFDVSNVKMSTYLVAFVISEFKPVNESEKFLNVWGRPEIVKYGEYAQNIAKAVINELENFTDIEYSLPKLDLVGIPDFPMGAMENWGLSTFREYGLFYNKTETTATYEKYIITIIAHELAHMWFGNLVTCAWWNYIWLNEGFAQYFEWYIADQIKPDYEFMNQFVVYELQPALLQDSLSLSHPMTNSVEQPKEINNIFDYVTYGKSASVLRMLFNTWEVRKNPETYKLVLRHYLNKQRNGTALPTDLWESFEKFVSIEKASIKEIMDSWTNQPGYPVVNATLNNNIVTLTQERFLMNRSTTTYEFYWIPIHITLSNQDFNQIINIKSIGWLGSEKEKIYINLNNEWFIVNSNQFGFYRVNYDTYSWGRLIDQLNSERFESIHVLNRAQIIDDLFNLARATYVDYELVLNASRYLTRETNHLPWKAFFNGLSYVYERFEQRGHQKHLEKYILKILSTMYNKTGFNDRDDDKFLDKLNREMILQWACKLNNKECVKNSKDLFMAWRKNIQKRIPCNARPAVYCTAIKEGNILDWNFLYEQYLNTNFDSERKIIINALGCSTDKAVLKIYLQAAIQKYNTAAIIRRQDVSAVFASVYSASQLGVNFTLDFLITNISEVLDYFGNWDDVATLFHNVASHISSWGQYNKLSKFVDSYVTLHAPDKARFASAISTAEANLMWYQRHNQTINQWIKNEFAEPLTDNGSNMVRSMNVIFMTLIALISYFLSCY